MANHFFFGGVRPYDGKSISKDVPIRTLIPESGDMVIPLLQHVGRPARPVVYPGDYVRTGQLIGEADGDLSANVHSSISGTVISIQDMPDVQGRMIPSVIIDNDGLYLENGNHEEIQPDYLNRRMVVGMLRDAGVVGMGGAGFPTAYKLQTAKAADIDTIIANCVECEPYETSDYRRLLEDPWKVLNGIMVLLTIYPNARGFIAIAEDNDKCYKLLKKILQRNQQSINDRIYIKRVENKFPAGSERQLIYSLTGRSLNAKMLPFEVGCLVCNTDTLVAINQAVIMNEPLLTRIITVTGNAAAKPANYRVRIGMTYRQLLEQAGGLRGKLHLKDVLLLDGGTMTGQEIQELDAPITKLSSAIVCLRKNSIPAQKETACIRCGKCLESCPIHLSPIQLYKDIQNSDKPSFVQHSGLECCSCNCCSYICPAKIDLGSSISVMRHECMKNKQLAGDYARRIDEAILESNEDDLLL